MAYKVGKAGLIAAMLVFLITLAFAGSKLTGLS